MSSLVAAVQSGADAVYLGLTEFSARRGAANFSLEELGEATRYAHLRGCKVYLAINTLVLPAEVGEAVELAVAARGVGIDAFIVQDLGLARALKKLSPDVALHASTQLSTHTTDGVEALASAGFERVTLARELTVEEIAAIATGPLPVEVFVHGALCFCYSGQCLLSSIAGGRSGNRGLCVQACRLAYELLNERMAGLEAGGDYPLSTKDLAAIDLLPALVASGVSALKIEGRLKSVEYVATVTDVYRRALDRYRDDPAGYGVDDADRFALEEAFSRGFTEGYLAGVKDHRMMSVSRPSDRGVPIGRVVSCDRGSSTCDVKLTRDLSAGDEIQVWVRKGGRVGGKVGEMTVDGTRRDVAGAGEVAAVLMGGAARGGAIRPDDRVFRTANARLLEAARERLRPSGQVRTTPVDLRAVLRVGEPIMVSAKSADGFEARVEGAVVDSARHRALDESAIAVHVGRLGGTAYAARRIKVDVEAEAYLPVSAIHEARDRLMKELDELRLAPWRRAGHAGPNEATHTISAASNAQPAAAIHVSSHTEHSRAAEHPRKPARPKLCVSADDARVASAVAIGGGLDWLYFDPSFTRDYEKLAVELIDAADAVRAAGGCFALQAPAILHDGELDEFERLAEALDGRLDGIVAGNIGQMRRFRDRGDLITEVGLNVTNPEAAGVLADMGAARVALSHELAGEQIGLMARGVRTPLEVPVFGPLQVMVAEHCVFSAPGSCSGCAGREGFVRDAKGFVFNVRIDRSCRTRIYNPFDLLLAKQLPELATFGIDAVRLVLFGPPEDAVEGVKEFKQILSLLPEEPEAAGMLAERLSGRRCQQARHTTGHYFRPIK